MTSRLDMTPEVGIGRAFSLAGASVALCVGMILAFLVVSQPMKTGQALLDLISPVAQASSLQSDEPASPEPLPTSAQAKTWDAVVYGEHDFDPKPGRIED